MAWSDAINQMSLPVMCAYVEQVLYQKPPNLRELLQRISPWFWDLSHFSKALYHWGAKRLEIPSYPAADAKALR